MAAVSEKLMEEVRALPSDEQRQLWEMLNALRENWEDHAKYQQVVQKMLDDGLINRIPPPIIDFTPYRNRTPIEVRGKPLSETIVEERR